jgi:hypothetical protein
MIPTLPRLPGLPYILRMEEDDLDIVTADWVTRTLANGGTVTGARIAAVDAFIRGVRSDGDLSLITEMWCGAAASNLAAVAVPVIRTNSAAVWTLNNFVAGDLTPGTGLVGDGTTKWIGTGLDITTITQDSNAVLVGVAHVGTSIGSIFGTTDYRFAFNASFQYAHRNFRSSFIADTVVATAPAILYGVRRNATDWQAYKENVSFGTSALASTAASSVNASLFRSQETSVTFTDARLWCYLQFGAAAPSEAARTRIYDRVVALRSAIV